MTKREQQIVNLIKKNPFLSQSDLAEELGITRSSAGVHLGNLMKKGVIKGKGYIIDQEPYICVLGGANIDIVGIPNEPLVAGDTNTGRLQWTLGGVGRNISEGLAHLDVPTKLITAIGDDIYSKKIKENCIELAIDISDSLFLHDTASPILLAIMDVNHDISRGISAMEIYQKLSVDFLRKKKKQIQQSRLTVVDTNITELAMEYVTSNFKSEFFMDTTSGSKVYRAKNIFKRIHYLKSNIREAEILWGNKVTNQADLDKMGTYFLNNGVKNVFITMGDNGVFYCDQERFDFLPGRKVEVVNTNGAGGAFCSGVIYGIYHKYSMKESVEMGMRCAELTVAHSLNVNPQVSELRTIRH